MTADLNIPVEVRVRILARMVGVAQQELAEVVDRRNEVIRQAEAMGVSLDDLARLAYLDRNTVTTIIGSSS